MGAQPVITLLTDFGSGDVYVGSLKGVILGINPSATIVDLCHEVRPQAIAEAAYLLKAGHSYFPAGTIHLCVVDPGVGTERKAIAARCGDFFFVGPDNGLLTLVAREHPVESAVELREKRFHLPQISATFAGRDLFAPVAAHLSLGVPLEQLGPPAGDLVQLALGPIEREERLVGHIIHLDHFGSGVTDIDAAALTGWLGGRPFDRLCIQAGRGFLRGVCRTYADKAPGQPLALLGSAGHLEIAVNRGSAAERFGLFLGQEVIVQVEAR